MSHKFQSAWIRAYSKTNRNHHCHKRIWHYRFFILTFCVMIPLVTFSQDVTEGETNQPTQAPENPVEESGFGDGWFSSPGSGIGESPEAGMTLMQLLKTGGWIMVVLFALSVLVLALAIYYFFTMTERRLIPQDVLMQFRHLLLDGRLEEVERICQARGGLLCQVVLSGLTEARERPNEVAVRPEVIGAAMEQTGRREADLLMRKVRYLSEVATISPMLGLLGTVIGMIKAFNVIAFDFAVVKPVALAGSVSQALVTTAAGLIVGIPAMGLYFLFRGRLQRILGKVEVGAMMMNDFIVRAIQQMATSSRRETRR